MHRYLSAIIIAVALMLTGCRHHKDEPLPEPEPAANTFTLFVYMPWSGSTTSSGLTNYFYENLKDLTKAIEATDMEGQRVIVLMSETATTARMSEIKEVNGAYERVTLKEYDSPECTTVEGMSEIFTDMKGFAPADRYSMSIGCHGLGWLPVSGTRTSTYQAAPLALHPDWPVTRYFGGSTSQFQTEISTLRDALRDAGLHMQFILFDDCYMSSVEVAYELRAVTDHIIACPTEIMGYGMPYHTIGEYMMHEPDYKRIAEEFYTFYSEYRYPWATLGITDCRQLDALADVVREIYRSYGDVQVSGVQRMDGYVPTIFYDLGDYIHAICTDTKLLQAFDSQMDLTVIEKAHTGLFYCDQLGPERPVRIDAFSGLTTSAPSKSSRASKWSETSWSKAIQ